MEREGSISSASSVARSLDRQEIPNVMIEYQGEKNIKILPKGSLIFNCVHGLNGEDGTISRICEQYGHKYNFSSEGAHRLTYDKIEFYKFAQQNGILVPQHYAEKQIISQDVSASYLIKRRTGGGSLGITGPFRPNEIQGIEIGSEYYVERYIDGRFATIIVNNFNEKIEISDLLEVNFDGHFFNYTAKRNTEMREYFYPGRFSESLSEAARNIANKVFCMGKFSGVLRLAFMIDNNETLYTLEGNSVPGLSEAGNLAAIWNGLGRNYDHLIKSLCNSIGSNFDDK